jgi:putative nucleotidyltransferase with HDIG domain
MAAIYTLRELSQRSQLLRTACFIALTYWVAYIALELMLNGSTNGFQITMIGYLAINAALISFAYILMFVAEKVFGFTSIVTLVELADINNSLLRELSDKCPGTFQHSMAVSNMASDAAAKIGANVQLVRAGALYHDLGKMSNPAFFTENQGGVNPHESLPPTRSAEIVINHVNDGLKIADKAKLPSVIKDFIKEHHGRGQAKYFYFTYCQQHPEEKVDPAPFTYPGPNPQSRETSIMMMADAVEAASRSLKEHTAESVTNLVNKIIDGQIADGLHNDSPLSFKDIAIIKDTFIKRLKTMYHARIAYPDDPNKKQQNEGNAQ